ncbi:hypothetical protein BVI2075_160007 [Burkholderia vietnamiensis]|nr:hypothetical protein BVI2075_160007 [Burkholderia vietnamiensis]
MKKIPTIQQIALGLEIKPRF